MFFIKIRVWVKYCMIYSVNFTKMKNRIKNSHFVGYKIRELRKKLGFKGILISDDISMKALKYDIETNALKAISAGCNLVLHCNGKIKEMKKLAKIVPRIDIFTKKKTSQFYKFLR